MNKVILDTSAFLALLNNETIRSWCYKFGKDFEKVIKKKQRKVTDKWHLDEMTMKVNGEYFMIIFCT